MIGRPRAHSAPSTLSSLDSWRFEVPSKDNNQTHLSFIDTSVSKNKAAAPTIETLLQDAIEEGPCGREVTCEDSHPRKTDDLATQLVLHSGKSLERRDDTTICTPSLCKE